VIAPELYDQARDCIAAHGFTPAVQAKIALVLGAAKNGNLAFQAVMQWVPALGVAQQFIISQAARECEAVALLARTAQWLGSPALLPEAGRITAPLLSAWGRVMQLPGPLFSASAVYRGLSLGHAQFARMRLAPILPDDAGVHPFAVALARIEQENGRMLQTQVRLLKVLGGDIPLAEREALIEADQALVDGVMSAFLAWLAAPEAEASFRLPDAALSPWRLPWPASKPTPWA
jgi:hypothetical protein